MLLCEKDRSRRHWSRTADRQTVLRERCPAGWKPDGKLVKIAHAEHSIKRVCEVNRRSNQYHETLSDGNARWTDGALQRLGVSDTKKHVLTGRNGVQRVMNKRTAHK